MLIAIAGNPNCGKTTIFNALTGSHQKVANYPGVTVEKKIGRTKFEGIDFEFVDLPGTYGLSAYAEDEVVARNFLLNEKIDLVINVIDSVSIERNLYLTTQLLELKIPMVLVLNMVDAASSKGVTIDEQVLEKYLGLPVIRSVAYKGIGISDIVSYIVKLGKGEIEGQYGKTVSFGTDIDDASKEIVHLLKEDSLKNLQNFSLHWLSLRLIEDDEVIWKDFKKINHKKLNEIKKVTEEVTKHLKSTLNDSIENVMSDYRYGQIYSLKKYKAIQREDKGRSISDKIDQFFLHRFLGPILLLFVLWLFYFVVFNLSETPIIALESLFALLHETVDTLLPESIFKSLIVSGMIDGVGGILGFTPLIMLMFLVISFLEDSGYMARVAFLLDRLLRYFGMHGNSILSYVVAGGVAGGCAVPGVMAARTLRDPKERLATILTAPFMNCGAKLPVFSLFIASFFSNNQGTMMFFITLLSWFFALVIAGILRSTVLKGESTPFVMELPPYRLPTFKGMLIHMWERTWLYVKKAGTMILTASIIVWVLMSFPRLDLEKYSHLPPEELAQQQLSYSVAGRIGNVVGSVTRPLLGFDWQTNIALIGGLAAKEVVVSTLGVAYSLGEVDEENPTNLQEKLSSNKNWNPIKAFALILFVMLYMPCISVVAIIRKETHSYKMALFSVFYTTLVALFVSTLFYQSATFLTTLSI